MASKEQDVEIQINEQNGQFFPVIKGVGGYITDYLTDPKELLQPVVHFLREFTGQPVFDFNKSQFSVLKPTKKTAEEKFECLKRQHEKNKIAILGKNYKDYSARSQYLPMLEPHPTLGLSFLVKRSNDADPLAILMSPEQNKLYFFNDFAVDAMDKFGKKNKASAISIATFLYLVDWWQYQKEQKDQKITVLMPNFYFRNKLTPFIFSYLDEQIAIISRLFTPQNAEYELIEKYEQYKQKFVDRKFKRFFSSFSNFDAPNKTQMLNRANDYLHSY